jgi:hypothetical protein
LSFLNRSHVSEVATPTVRWDRTQGAFTYSKRIDNKWRNDVPITEAFAMDVHMARHGYEQWQVNGESQARHVVLDSVSCALPAKPEGKAMAIYSVPICSPEIGGRCDLVVHGQGPTDALCDLFDEIHGHIHDLDESKWSRSSA